jgi:hypothetical protein
MEKWSTLLFPVMSIAPSRTLLNPAFTLSLQINVVYDTMARDELLGRPSNRTGLTAWYLGPLLNVTWGSHLSTNAGIDLPLRIANNGFQSVPDYRLHGGVSLSFRRGYGVGAQAPPGGSKSEAQDQGRSEAQVRSS